MGEVPPRLAIRYSGDWQLTAGAHSGRRRPGSPAAVDDAEAEVDLIVEAAVLSPVYAALGAGREYAAADSHFAPARSPALPGLEVPMPALWTASTIGCLDATSIASSRSAHSMMSNPGI